MSRQTATVTDEGQITMPREVRHQLNVRDEAMDVFEKYVGALPAFRNKREIASWISEMRDAPPGAS